MASTTAVPTEPIISNPDTQVPQGERPPVQGNPAAEAARRELYEKHYGTEGTSSASATPALSPASVAQTDPTTGTSSASTAVPTFPPEVVQLITALQGEISSLKTQLKPAAPAPVVDPNKEPEWVTALREGRVNDADKVLVQALVDRAKDPIIQAAVDQAVARAREVNTAESEVRDFIREVRSAHSDIAVLEPLIVANVGRRLETLKASGNIKSTDDAVREYKKAVLEETESARKIAQQLRGAGKTEAMVRQSEVLSASTLVPNQVTSTTQKPPADGQAVTESPEDYFAKRRQKEYGLHNPLMRGE